MAPHDSWQSEAIKTYERSSESDFLLVATPGAGKTKVALEIIKKRGMYAVVVVPSKRLRKQWMHKAHSVGLDLDPTYTNQHFQPPDTHGMIVTYQQVRNAPQEFRAITSRRPTIVVLDEIHHCGDEKDWGDAVQQAFEPAAWRLALSGTPFRQDNATIPFVRYEPCEGGSRSRADYCYSYANALIDGVVRRVQFRRISGTARLQDRECEIETVEPDDESWAHQSALDPESEILHALLLDGQAQLRDARLQISDAGGLIVAKDRRHAENLASKMSEVCGVKVKYVSCDDDDAHNIIDRFAKSNDEWLVAINMISEGVDIPRLLVCVYATDVRYSEMYFRQTVGRVVRRRPSDGEWFARVVIPAIPSLDRLAAEIEEERDHAVRELERRERESVGEHLLASEWDGGILPATNGYFAGAKVAGVDIAANEALAAQVAAREFGIDPAILQAAFSVYERERKQVPPMVDDEAPTERRERKAQRLNRLVTRYPYESLEHIEHRDAWAKLHKEADDGCWTMKQMMTEDQLNRRIEIILGWPRR